MARQDQHITITRVYNASLRAERYGAEQALLGNENPDSWGVDLSEVIEGWETYASAYRTGLRRMTGVGYRRYRDLFRRLPIVARRMVVHTYQRFGIDDACSLLDNV